jgi:hypothetical protein
MHMDSLKELREWFLEDPEATVVWVQGEKVFEKRENLGWFYIGN